MRNSACWWIGLSGALAVACTGSHPVAPDADSGLIPDGGPDALPDGGTPPLPDGGLPDAGPGVELDDFCDGIGRAVAEAARGGDCVCDAERADVLGAEVRQACEDHPFHQWLRDGEARYDPAAAARLLADAGRLASCWGFFPDRAERVVVGTVPEGSPCELIGGNWMFFLHPCADDQVCRWVAGSDYACTREREVGESCADEDLCATGGLYCDERTRTCREYASAGESCAERECRHDLSCWGDVCTAPYERPPLFEGDYCELGYGPTCEAGLLCLGSRCAIGGRGGDACEGAADCRSGACVDGACVDPGGPLEACADIAPIECRGHHAAGACGPSCVPSEWGTPDQCLYLCESGSCIDGICRRSVEPGDACTDDVDCSSNLCIGGLCRAAICDPT